MVTLMSGKESSPNTTLLHRYGLKSTPLREALLTIFSIEHTPLTAQELKKKLSKMDYDEASLFRSLRTFIENGIIHTIDLGEGFLRYEKTCEHHDHHHHVICKICKKVELIPFCIPKKIENFLKKSGYQQLTHRLDFEGICAHCKA